MVVALVIVGLLMAVALLAATYGARRFQATSAPIQDGLINQG